MALMLSVVPAIAQEAEAGIPPAANFFSFNTDSLLMMFALFLTIPIYFLARLLIFGVKINLDKKAKALSVLAILGLLSTSTAEAATFSQFNYVTWTLVLVILIELLVIAILGYHATKLLNWFTESGVVKSEVKKPGFAFFIWQKMNKFRPMEEESELEIGHEYDGIKELDNVTPPWFTMGFVASIIFAIIYLWVYHVSESAPLQVEEYRREVVIAEAAHAEFLKNQANQVDENNVTLLTDAGSIANGKKLFDANCVACHKSDGGGSIGPNLTDEYWLHGGSVKDIFSTIKYGVLDKGMVPWKDEMSPNQIAQLVAYIHTLKGTNPPGAKVAEGAIYSEGAESAEAPADAPAESTEQVVTE